MILRLADYRCK